MLTMLDARNDRIKKNLNLEAKIQAREDSEKAIAEFLKANPDVGLLIRKGKKVLYRFRNNVYEELKNPCVL